MIRKSLWESRLGSEPHRLKMLLLPLASLLLLLLLLRLLLLLLHSA